MRGVVVPGEPAHRPAMLTRHDRRMSVIDHIVQSYSSGSIPAASAMDLDASSPLSTPTARIL